MPTNDKNITLNKPRFEFLLIIPKQTKPRISELGGHINGVHLIAGRAVVD